MTVGVIHFMSELGTHMIIWAHGCRGTQMTVGFIQVMPEMLRDNQMTAGVIFFVSGILRGTQITGSATAIFFQISKA